MNIQLICSKNRKVITEILNSRGIRISDDADIVLVERGAALPEPGIAIVYDSQNLNPLIDFLDNLSVSSKKTDLAIIPVKNADSYEILQPSQVYYFFSEGNYIYCITKNAKFEVKKKLYELEIDLGQQGFIRINKSTIVNILKVSEISPWFGGRLVLKLNELNDKIFVSRSYVSGFKEFLGL